MDKQPVHQGHAGRIPWDRILIAFTVLAGVVSIIFILDNTKFPDPVWHPLIFQYLLREQDVAGSVLVICIAIGAYLPRTRSAALDPVGLLSRNLWPTAALTFIGLSTAMFVVVQNHPLAGDEHLAIFQSRAFAAGHLTGQYPLDLLARLIPTQYQSRWLIASDTGAVAPVYWPGFALLLAPFTLIGAPWACNALLASLSLVLMAKVATRLTGSVEAGGWAMLFALGSPGFTGLALSYFSMTAHLFLNLLFAWLLLERTPSRLVLAGVVGSFALVQSNPVPHILFALPWLVWVSRQPDSRRSSLALGAGYAPLALLLGLGWWLFLRQLQGRTLIAPFPSDADFFHRLANLLWYLYIEFRTVFTVPGDETIAKRIGEQVRLWSWAVPGLPLLALAGWWLGRHIAEVNLFALSLVATLVGYLFVSFDQGYGWGARYVHSAWSVLPILASAAMVSIRDPGRGAPLRSYVGRVALFSLAFATVLRFFQIHLFMDGQLLLRPPFEKGVRQIVFIAPNHDYYTQDFVQNDPFLREPVIFMMSRGQKWDDENIVKRRFPQSRLTYEGANGRVWRLD
jgi:hypothetical protein